VEKEVREIRIVLSGKRIILSGILAGILFFAAVAGTFALMNLAKAQPAAAEGYQAAANAEKAWIFAEGYTGEGFDEWILLYNPDPTFGGTAITAKVRLCYYNNSGSIGYDEFTLAPAKRLSVNVNEMLKLKGYSGDVTVCVLPYSGSIENRVPIVAERAMYFNYQGVWSGGSQTMGYPVK
jgi:hypothetical protein